MQLIYKPFEDEEDETDEVYRQAEAFAAVRQDQAITDVKSAAGAPAAPLLGCALPFLCHLQASSIGAPKPRVDES